MKEQLGLISRNGYLGLFRVMRAHRQEYLALTTLISIGLLLLAIEHLLLFYKYRSQYQAVGNNHVVYHTF